MAYLTHYNTNAITLANFPKDLLSRSLEPKDFIGRPAVSMQPVKGSLLRTMKETTKNKADKVHEVSAPKKCTCNAALVQTTT